MTEQEAAQLTELEEIYKLVQLHIDGNMDFSDDEARRIIEAADYAKQLYVSVRANRDRGIMMACCRLYKSDADIMGCSEMVLNVCKVPYENDARIYIVSGMMGEITDYVRKIHDLTLETFWGIPNKDGYYRIDPDKGVCEVWPQDVIPEPGKQGLPTLYGTEREKKYYARAIEAGLMERTTTGYRWLFGGGRGLGRLGYFVEKLYCPNNTEDLPEKEIDALFGVNRISSAAGQVYNVKTPQRWRAAIDEIFAD